ncbi:hypothetical protein D3C76_1024640 [compost metagenome]
MLIDRHMIGFGGSEQQLIDNRRKQTAEQCPLPVVKTLHQLGERQAHIVEGLRPAVQRLQTVHQHNLTVEAQEVVFIKPLHHFLAVIIKAIAQHPDVGVFVRHRQF